MLVRDEHIDKDGKLGIWKIEEPPDELLQLFPESLRSRAASHIENLRSEKRVTEWLSTRLLLLQLLNEDKIVHHHRNGQPYLTDQSYRISISHTNNYAAILLHPFRKVGIDVEYRSERVAKISSKFISPEEFVDESQKLLHQTLLWSAKETLFKIIGEDAIDFRCHLHIHPFSPQSQGVMTASETKTPERRLFEVHYEVFPEYVLTWAVA
ncbi:MAG: 4'-phosphopantetheinyl transferase superfamily protein [Dysgonamonadaceae bacterium]|jgi:phosphopantetheinyl transferase|nr:4'-phosphopantetheinyl transferase superfamily protein [Dysgonamonadaceae bacterium]